MEHAMLIIQIIISITLPLWLGLWLTRQIKRQFAPDSCLGSYIPDTHFLLKRWWAEWCIAKKVQSDKAASRNYEQVYRAIKYVQPHSEKPKTIKDDDSCDSLLFYGADQKGNSLFIKFAVKKRRIAEVTLQLVTADKQIYVLPDYPNTTVTASPNHKWSAAGLKVDQLEAQHRWRITYNGLLRNISKEDAQDEENIEHVRLNCLFVSSSRPLQWPGDWSTKLHADAVAHEPWRSPQWMSKIKLLDYRGLDQWGSIVGEVIFKDSSVTTLYFRGLRQHRWGKHESHQFHKAVVFFGVMSSGAIFYLGAGSSKHSFSRMYFGQLKHSSEKLRKIDWMNFELSDFNEDNCVNRKRNIRFIAEGLEYKVLVKFNNATTFFSGQPWNWANQIVNLSLESRGRTGIGVMQLWYPYNGPCPVKPPVAKLQYMKRPNVQIRNDDYVVFFSDEKCQNESVVGGKGFSLGVLTSIKNANFVVPEGFCVTALAFQLQLQSQKGVEQVVNEVVAISTGKKKGDLQECCKEAMRVIQSTPVVEPVKDAILKAIEKLESVNGEKEQHKYAVRSSAVGEDSEETSAAGQNSTYLGVRGAENIVKSIAKCWASLFSYQSVHYRKQHGLDVNASMGVCVQKMVDAEAAGVMFTRHPTTGDPSDIIITANYGLGETVVSAMVEPDTITVHRSWDNRLSIKSSVLGKKAQKILMTDDGVTTAALDEQEAQKVSISEKTALELASIGIDLEILFGNARDIEWAVSKDKIFLLQARPITTLTTWTDFELTHELDASVPSDIDLITFANVGEVFPYPISPLSISVIVRIIDTAIAYHQKQVDLCFLSVNATRCTINYYNSMMQVVEKDITVLKKVSDIAICGNVVITPEIHKIAHERNGPFTAAQQFYLIYDMVKGAWDNATMEKKAREFRERYSFNTDDYRTAADLYMAINNKFDELYEIGLYHAHTSRVSVSFQVMLLGLLVRGYEDFIPDHFRDIAVLLSSCTNVVSTEVPIMLGQIAQCIKAYGKAEEFSKIDPTNANVWLKENCPVAAEKLDELFKAHGHRCIQELDFMSEPWCFKPETLVETIQTLSVSSEEITPSKELSVEETVASLKTPKSKLAKSILRKVVPFCRKAVARREFTKAELVSVVHSFKLAYRKLGTFMVQESYLPSEKLVFFLTHQEIGDLLKARNPGLVQKAYRRSRLYPKLAELQYPELNTGVPQPIKVSHDSALRDDSAKIQGTSVCSGSVLGRACVIKDLSEAKEIQSGDILITLSTDIGWSPYFPLLGGIVTELGGLISHGAVVAREYGVPCIIGATGATHMFKTGDTVLLVGDSGVLQMIQRT